jgi:hypothetical protein
MFVGVQPVIAVEKLSIRIYNACFALPTGPTTAQEGGIYAFPLHGF